MNYFDYNTDFPGSHAIGGSERVNDLVREFKEQDNCGVSGLLRQAEIFHEDCRTSSREDYDAFCRDMSLTELDRNLLGSIGVRLTRLRKIYGPRLEAVALLRLLLEDHVEFEDTVDATPYHRELTAGKLMHDLVKTIESESLLLLPTVRPPKFMESSFSVKTRKGADFSP
jgi:hypothetical protein